MLCFIIIVIIIIIIIIIIIGERLPALHPIYAYIYICITINYLTSHSVT